MPGVIPPEIDAAVSAGQPVPGSFSAEEKRCVKALQFFYKHVGYAVLMGDPTADAHRAERLPGRAGHVHARP